MAAEQDNVPGRLAPHARRGPRAALLQALPGEKQDTGGKPGESVGDGGSREVGGGGGGGDDRVREGAGSPVPSTLSPLSPEAPGTPCGQSEVRVWRPVKGPRTPPATSRGIVLGLGSHVDRHVVGWDTSTHR